MRAFFGLAAVTFLAALGIPSAAVAGEYRWAAGSVRFASTNQLIPATVLQRGPSKLMTRRGFVLSLIRLEQYRELHQGVPAQIPQVTTGAKLADEPATSPLSKAVALGWIAPQKGRFNGRAAVTANETARGVIAALGLRSTSQLFAARLRANAPGLRMNFSAAADQVLVRVLELRYNHLQGADHLEVSPHEHMSVGHVAYMLKYATQVSSWRRESLQQFEQFQLPQLRPNQRRFANQGLRLLGFPYVWGGESELNGPSQPNGQGGFDCSGFIWRVVNGSGVPAAARTPLRSRTSMAMSGEIVRSKRIGAAALRPGDLMFWAPSPKGARPADNYHAGMYLGNGWVIHSTGGRDGVVVEPFDGWLRDQFTWGRRILRG